MGRIFEEYLTKTDFADRNDFTENYRVNVPKNFNFAYDVMDALADRKPDEVALQWLGQDDVELKFSYAELKAYSDKAAHFFRSKGIGKGDMVMLVLKQRYQYWYCMLALHKLGAVAIPTTHLLSAEDFDYRLRAADVKMIVCANDETVLDNVDGANAPHLQHRAVTDAAGSLLEGWLDFDAGVEGAAEDWKRPSGPSASANEDMMLMYFTSGTMGEPKMVTHDFTFPLAQILSAVYWQGVQKGERHLAVSDTGWSMTAWGKLYGQWLGEGSLFIYEYDDQRPEMLPSVIEKYSISTFCASPSVFRYLVQLDLKNYNLSTLCQVTSGGEELNPEVALEWKRKTGLEVYEGYGQAETSLLCATVPPFVSPRYGAFGVPLPGCRVVICDEDGFEVGAGVPGEICVRTDELDGGVPLGLFKGYYRNDELTRKVWNRGLYHTGDMAYRDEKGYIWYFGRIEDVIKASGYRIGPFEIENVLMEHPAVMEVAVTEFDAGVKATLVLAGGYQPSDDLTAELQDLVRRKTVAYKVPKLMEYIDHMPKTISGKIQRSVLREQGEGKA